LRYDAVVHGSDLTAVWLANRLHSKGFRVLVLEEGPRLGGRHPYLPVLEGTIRAEGVPKEALLHGPFKLTLKLRLGERVMVRGSSERVWVLGVRRLAEHLTLGGCEVHTWCRPLFHRTDQGEFTFRAQTPHGEVSGTAEHFVSTQPLNPVGVGEVRASVIDSSIECSLEVGRRSLTLKAPLSPRAVVEVGNPQSHRRTFSRTPLLAGQDRRTEGVLELGEASGDVLPPWAGDYALESATVGLKVLESVLSGGESAEVLLHEHRMRVRMRRALLSGVESGGLIDVDLDVFLEAFSPGRVRL